MRIGVLTSGGDAPGLNAAVRAVARTAFFRGWDVMGIWAGYRGLLEGRIYPMDRRRLAGIPTASDRILASRLGRGRGFSRWRIGRDGRHQGTTSRARSSG